MNAFLFGHSELILNLSLLKAKKNPVLRADGPAKQGRLVGRLFCFFW